MPIACLSLHNLVDHQVKGLICHVRLSESLLSRWKLRSLPKCAQANLWQACDAPVWSCDDEHRTCKSTPLGSYTLLRRLALLRHVLHIGLAEHFCLGDPDILVQTE